MKILVLNSGSSTQKSALYDLGHDSSSDPVPPLWEGKIEWEGDHESSTIRNNRGHEVRQQQRRPQLARSNAVEAMLRQLWSGETAVLSRPDEIDVVGHRIVHGGAQLTAPVIVNGDVKQAIRDVAAIAPLHNQAGLEGIEIAEELFMGKPQVAVFDTGFHRTMPDYASIYPGPYDWCQRGIRRYGFHGINHQYCASRAGYLLRRELSSLKIVSCHLGNGCSLAAIAGGKSIDTTMGFTPLDGVMMGMRGGSVDPGILIHLMRTQGADAQQLDNILNRKSGLLGISGVSSDMRQVLDSAREGNDRARLAFDIFIHRLQSGIAAMAASLAGMDVLVFTAGIGENSAEVRRAACANLAFLGVELDNKKNDSAKPDVDVSAKDSRVAILVIRAQEDWSIARECVRVSATS